MSLAQQLAERERELAQLQAQLPKHSLPPNIQARLDELEEAIAALQAQLAAEKENSA